MLLSIGMIVKNEEKTLRACLEGIKPILEQVQSELIIADTGSTDGTLAIARDFTENVCRIEWRGDFAWARNTTLDRARGQWYMFLDADEVFQDVHDIVRFFNSGEYKKYRSASHLMFMKGDEARNVYTRLFKKEPGTRFQGKIHEQIPLQPPVKNLESASLHSGYYFEGEDGEAKKAAKHERNMRPLLETYKNDPRDQRGIALIVNELMSVDDLQEARRFIDTGLALGETEEGRVFYHFLKCMDVVCLVKSKECEKAVARAEDYFKTYKKLFASSINTRLAQALALGKLERYEEAAETYKEALDLIGAFKSKRLDDWDVRMNVVTPPSKQTEKTAAAGIAGNYAALGDFNASYSWVKKYGLETAVMLDCLRSGRKTEELENFVRRSFEYLPKTAPDALHPRDRFICHAKAAYDHKSQGDFANFISGMRAALKEDPSMGEAVKKDLLRIYDITY